MTLRAVVKPHVTAAGTEHMIYLELPAKGGDGCLIGVTETKEAADEIARVFQRVIDCEKGWQRVISPNGKPVRW